MTLIDRLKAAPGPSRELDAEIAVAVLGWTETVDDGVSLYWERTDARGMIHRMYGDPVPHFTGDVQAVMDSLVDLSATPGFALYTGYNVEEKVTVWVCTLGDEDGVERWQATHATPALALVIACLMARGVGNEP
jgi:hypothetical protein